MIFELWTHKTLSSLRAIVTGVFRIYAECSRLHMPPTEKYDHLGQKPLQCRKYFSVVKRNQLRKFLPSAYNEYRMLRA